MSSRQTSDTTSASGLSYAKGAAAQTAASSNENKNLSITKDTNASTVSLLGKNGPFNGHAVEVWADGAVWDTVSGAYLYPGRDYNPGDLQRK